jgi:hypothetical protein
MNESGMHIDNNAAMNPTNTPETPLDSTIVVTLGMWNHLLSRLSTLEATLENRYNEHQQVLEGLDGNHQTLKNRHNTLEREYYEQALLTHKNNHQEPKIPDPPTFSGDRKELLPFLTKCQLKFEGQPSRFPTERSKILYAGSRLDGPAFSWFQPLIALYPAGSETAPPPELHSYQTFKEALTIVYGDPNLEATTVREIRRLHQTGSAAEYAAKFESKKQYIPWNDEAFRDQFYLNLREDLKDEIAPVGKPKTYLELKTLTIRLDARLFERKLERTGGAGANSSKSPPTRPGAIRPFTLPRLIRPLHPPRQQPRLRLPHPVVSASPHTRPMGRSPWNSARVDSGSLHSRREIAARASDSVDIVARKDTPPTAALWLPQVAPAGFAKTVLHLDSTDRP